MLGIMVIMTIVVIKAIKAIIMIMASYGEITRDCDSKNIRRSQTVQKAKSIG